MQGQCAVRVSRYTFVRRVQSHFDTEYLQVFHQNLNDVAVNMLKDLAPYDKRGLNTKRSKDLGTFNTDVASAYTDHSLRQFIHFEKAIACHT